MMHKFERHFAVLIVIMLMFLANTMNTAFGSTLLKEMERTQDFSMEKNSVLPTTQSSSDIYSYSGQGGDEKLRNRFQNPLLSFPSSSKEICFDRVDKLDDFICKDDDSAELVIGINDAEPGAYTNLINEISKSQGEIVNTVSIKDKVIAVVADLPLDAVSLFTEKVQGSGLARYVEPNMKFQTQWVPNDEYWSLQWGPQKIETDYAWNTTVGNSSILVAVIDTGIDYTHPDLENNYVPLGYDWVNDDNDPIDDFGHGTHCAGIIAATLNNTEGIAGLAQVRIMAEKALDEYGSGWEDDLANAIIDAVDKGAKILSNSWGGYGKSMLIHDAVKYAYDRGVLVIAAAGNEAWNQKIYPAAYEEVIAVTATDSSDIPAVFTNFGEWVEVAAPGVDIYSTMPTYHVTMNDWGYSMNYDYMSGTSMACPHAAGVAALIWSQFPNATRDWVRAQLRYTAEDLGDIGFDEYYGYGRINARNAVEQAPPEHDLLIFNWEKPAYIQPGDITSFNVNVLNFGTSDEQNVTVQLFVDGNLTDSKLISNLSNGTSTTVSLSWIPLEERTYNVTLYVVPVSGETAIENNMITKMISVRYITGFVLFDQTRCDLIDWYSLWVSNLTDRGYVVDTYTSGTITPDVLDDYDILVIPQAWSSYSSDEISAIQNFVLDGGGLLVIGDDYPWIYTDLTSFAGITWDSEYYGWYGYTTDITLHDVTDGVAEAYFNSPISQLYVNSPAIDLIRARGYDEVMLAASEVGTGRVIAIADENAIDDYDIVYADNLALANNMIDWLLGVKYQHELIVRLDVPSYLEPCTTSMLNATVYNRGLNNETNVELKLFINGSMVKNESIPLLVNGTKYKMNYTWSPASEGIYNITAYAPPVLGENVTINNIETKFVSVQYPLINPEPGQYANYIINYYDSSGFLTGMGYMNFTYEYYVEPYKIYVTAWQKDPSGYIYTGYMVVNTMTRRVESGNIWTGFWYPGWIETDIDIGSTINLLDGTATVNGTRILVVDSRAVDCWEIPYSMYGYPYTFWYDKASGLWIGMESTHPYTGERIEFLLAETDVPIGTTYEHDLGVTLEAPLKLQPGETSLLNATVYNLGLNNETNVEIQILINGTEVAYEKLANLVNGTWYTLNYSWSPASEGIYNITAYAPPVLGENVTINNLAICMVRVRVIEVALISANSELMTIAPILDSMGIGYDIYNDNNMYLYTEDLNLLLKYKAVVFYNRYRWITSTEYSTLESYLSLGGNLLVTGFDCLVSDTLLADLVRSSSTGDNVGEPDLYVVDGAHPIMNGPYGSFPAGYHIYGLYSDCDMAEADITRGAITVAELWDGYDRIIATDGLPGKVVFWNGDGTYDWIWNSDCEAMFKNLIYWFTVRYQHELIVSLETPSFLEPNDSATLNATVQNQGLNNETDVGLQLLINGTMVKNVTIPQLLTEESYTITYSWTPTITGKYNITVYAPPVPDENVTKNNVYSKIIPVQYAPKILAYVEYTDYYQDYPNTLRAIESSFGPNYELTELWDYTQLDLMLSGKDILLIPDQEYASLSTMQMIGSEWSETLNEFLEDGGVIILCDGFWGYGGTYGILTGAELMSIDYTNYRSNYLLHVADPSDPLTEGVSSSFVGPYYTVSFATEETNVVVEDDWHYPVVIHKEVNRGHIVLLGFDYESSNADTEQILGNTVALASYLIISVNPSVGSPRTEVTVSGTKATANSNVSIYWDTTFMGNTTANDVGEFYYTLTVPDDAALGIHQIMAIDTTTGKMGSTPFRVILITLNPNKGPVGTSVKVNGAGFSPETQAKVTFNDMLMGYAWVDNFGNFTFTFNIPFSVAGSYTIKAFAYEGNYACATFTVVDVTPLDVKVDVGAIYFRGEIAEFYSQVAFKGVAVNATGISAVLYCPDGETVSYRYPENITLITTGLYKISYTIPGDATADTYTLVVTANYVTDIVQANGTSFKCFQISPTLTSLNARVVEIKEDIATVILRDLRTIKLNLTDMDATLEKIFVKVLTINNTTATIQTTIGIINGTITSVEDDIATIVVPGLGQIQTSISSLKGMEETRTLSQYLVIIIVLIAASASLLMIFMKRRKTEESK